MATEVTEMIPTKTMCYGYPTDNSANILAAASLMNKSNSTPSYMDMAAISNGGCGFGGQWNNPFMYLVWMYMMRYLNPNGFNGNGVQNAELMSQISAIRETLSSNQNTSLMMDAIKGNNSSIHELANNLNCNFNTLSSGICDLRAAIQQLSGQTGFSAERIINAGLMGDNQIIQALSNSFNSLQSSIDKCCCQTQQSILKMGYDNQIQTVNQTNQIQSGLNYISTELERGFASTNYATQQQTCDIINAINSAQQRNSDLMNSHWNLELNQKYEDAKRELSQQNQTAALIAALSSKTTAAA